TLAAYHLDKLAEAGLLTTTYARPPGRGGPGAGRPAKHYTRTQRELAIGVPPRNYALLAELVTEAVAADDSGAVRAAVDAAARRGCRSGWTIWVDSDWPMAAWRSWSRPGMWRV